MLLVTSFSEASQLGTPLHWSQGILLGYVRFCKNGRDGQI